MGHKMAYAAVEQYEMKVASKILSNCDSWIGLTEEHITRMQTVQDNFFKQVFQVSAKGTPICIIRLDSQTLHISNNNEKTMDKEDGNICKNELVQGQSTCAEGDLHTECKEWCKKINIRCVTMETYPIPERASADNFKLKKGLWRENDKDIRLEMDQSEKVRNVAMPQKKIKRSYLAHQTIANARIWFRYRAKIIDDIKGNRSSLWTGRMHCRHCTTGESVKQEHIEE